jgi:hypothetical protein
LDYFATGKLNVKQATDVVKDIANACKSKKEGEGGTEREEEKEGGGRKQEVGRKKKEKGRRGEGRREETPWEEAGGRQTLTSPRKRVCLAWRRDGRDARPLQTRGL